MVGREKNSISRRTRDAFQKARRKLTQTRIYRGHRYKYYGASNNKAEMKKRASKRWERTYIVKMPEIIRRVDPEAAKYAVYVSGRKK